jgi:conjugal transfer/entry exclusion protein
VRVGKFLNSVKGLDWDIIATLTGDIGTVKKSIQTLNNRINGLNSPKIDTELQNYMIQMKNGVLKPQEKELGG